MQFRIASFKIGDSKEFTFGDSIDKIKNILEKSGISYGVEEYADEEEIYYFNIDRLTLIFDKERTFCGFCNDEVNFNFTDDMGIKLIDNSGEVYDDLIDINNRYCDHAIDLDEYYEAHESEGIVYLEGFLNYNTDLYVANKKSVIQITETYSYEETIVVIREDMVSKLPIIIESSDSKGVNLTELIVKL